ncbi:hypothetical protein [Spirosoma sp.]|uniref:hypothetical protein n=1 Tax=Spirosoma sp. TaxID=1899569 RepID=UPI00261AEA7E|nr:hypothetical protein [Spirosoma sp.]MCX6217663.1 hypothetical protein [Spirosoma sp.]
MKSQLEALVKTLESRRVEVKKKLDPKGYPILSATPWIVASEDAVYTVMADSDNLAQVEIGQVFPTQFSEAAANDLSANFCASNGHGPIEWVLMTPKDFYTIKSAELKQAIHDLKKSIRNL